MSKASYNLHNIRLVRHSLTVDACCVWTCIISHGQSTKTGYKKNVDNSELSGKTHFKLHLN